MATNRKASGERYSVQSASGNIASGDLVAQENFIGIALDTVLSGSTELTLAITGIWNIPVPSSTVAGDVLYTAGTASGDGATIADSATALTLTRTRSADAIPVGRATTDRDTAGRADVLLAASAAWTAAQQA